MTDSLDTTAYKTTSNPNCCYPNYWSEHWEKLPDSERINLVTLECDAINKLQEMISLNITAKPHIRDYYGPPVPRRKISVCIYFIIFNIIN